MQIKFKFSRVYEPCERCDKILASPMLLSNLFKIFLLFALLTYQSCSLWQGETNANTSPAPFLAAELKSEIPFLTKEPESFQTEIVITAGGSEEKIFAAKSGASRLLIFDYQQNREIAVLQIGANQTFTIARNQKIYAENPSGGAERETLNEFLIADLLNRKQKAVFELLGAENNLAKYRVRLDEAQKSEIIIYIDEKIGLPVKQEFYSVDGEQKTLTLTVELRNFTSQPKAGVFELPKDYRKVAPKELAETQRRDRDKK